MKKFFLCLYFVVLLGVFNIVLPYPQVSYELQSGLISADPAPLAPTSEKRVWLWLRKYAPVIRAHADKYRVPPVAIAGVIAWEGSQNDHVKRMTYGLIVNFIFTKGLFLKSIGPGKVQAWGDNNAAQYIEGNRDYQPVFPEPPPSLLPAVAQRILRLRDPATSIEYIAAIMNAYATDAEKAGYANLRHEPAALAAFFDGIRGYSLPEADVAFRRRMKEKGNVPFRLNQMGRWVRDNDAFLASALTIASAQNETAAP